MSSRKHSKQCNNFFHKVPTLNVFLFVGIVSKLLKVFSINCTKDYIHSSSQTSFLPVFWLNSEQHTDNFHFDWSYYFPTELKLLFSHYSSCSEFWTCNVWLLSSYSNATHWTNFLFQNFPIWKWLMVYVQLSNFI